MRYVISTRPPPPHIIRPHVGCVYVDERCKHTPERDHPLGFQQAVQLQGIVSRRVYVVDKSVSTSITTYGIG